MELQTKLHALEVGPVPAKPKPVDVESTGDTIESATLRDSFVGMSLSSQHFSDTMNAADVPARAPGAPPSTTAAGAPFGTLVRVYVPLRRGVMKALGFGDCAHFAFVFLVE